MKAIMIFALVLVPAWCLAAPGSYSGNIENDSGGGAFTFSGLIIGLLLVFSLIGITMYLHYDFKINLVAILFMVGVLAIIINVVRLLILKLIN